MCPGAVHALNLADDPLLKVEPALSPSEDFGHRRFSLERPKNCMSNRSMSQVNLAVSSARFESKPATSLSQTTHLQDFGRRELVEVSDERMARIDAFCGDSALCK